MRLAPLLLALRARAALQRHVQRTQDAVAQVLGAMRVVRRVRRVREAGVVGRERRQQRRRQQQELVVRVEQVVQAVQRVRPGGLVDGADVLAQGIVGYGRAEERVRQVRADRERA